MKTICFEVWVLSEKAVFVRPKDFIIIGALLILAATSWIIYSRLNTADAAYAKLYYKGEMIETVELKRNRIFMAPQVPEVEFEVRDGAICFLRSNCPDQVCVLAGRLSRQGEFAACLPNGLSIWIEGGENNGDSVVDAVVR